MFDFFKTEFRNTNAQALQGEVSTRFDSTQQTTGNAEALIRTVWKDLVRLHHLPAGAVGCEVFAGEGHGTEPRLRIELTLLQWSDTLALHMLALQTQLRVGLDQYEPDVDHSGLHIVWRIAADCGCPYQEIAETVDWSR